MSVVDSKILLMAGDLTCEPKEVGLSEWKIDDEVECRVLLWNRGGKTILIDPWKLIDGHELGSLGMRTMTPGMHLNLSFSIKFDDNLAHQIYGPGADATSFLKQKTIKIGRKCERGVCYDLYETKFYPTDHIIGIKLYFSKNSERVFVERSAKVTVVYDGYILSRYVQWLGTVTIEFILTITELPVTQEGLASTAGKKLLDR